MPIPVAAAAATIASTIGNIMGANSERREQRRYAQNQIQWRVKDAELAGVHPIYALGATPMQYSPVGVGDIGRGLADMGQDITRARMATMDRKERADALAAAAPDRALSRTMSMQQIENNKLQNQLLATQISRLQADQLPPAAPTGSYGGAPNPRVQPRPAEPIIGSAYNAGQEPGQIAEYGYSRTHDGGLAIQRSADVAQRLEEDWVGGIAWDMRNRLGPNIGYRQPPSVSEYPLPHGTPAGWSWRWNPVAQAYYPAPPPRASRRRGSYSQRPGNF